MYLSWNQKTITDFSDNNINSLYNQGYVFTRLGKGIMDQTRSIRINLTKFELNSENRRILRKTENITLQKFPLPYANYDWAIGKLGKDFYDTKFGTGTFSAQKIKELFTDSTKSNFNALLIYLPPFPDGKAIGYCVVRETNELLHYCYPFYQITNFQYPISNIGLGMMLKAIIWAKEQGKKYVYLGSFQRPTDTYKLQFAGLEWFDGKEWKKNHEELKTILKV